MRPARQVKPALATVEKAQPSDSFARVDYTPTLESAINEQARSCNYVMSTLAPCCCTDCLHCVPQINIEYNIRCSNTHLTCEKCLLPFAYFSLRRFPTVAERQNFCAGLLQHLWHLMSR